MKNKNKQTSKEEKKRTWISKDLKLPLGKKVIKDLLREKTILFIVFLQLFIILASSVILTNSNVLFNPSAAGYAPIGIGVYDMNSTLSSQVRENAEIFLSFLETDAEHVIFIKRYAAKEDAISAFTNHEVDALIGFSSSESPFLVKASVPKGDFKTSLVTNIIKEKLEMFQNHLRKERLDDERLVELSKINMKNKASSASVSLFESLYNIVIPFLLLLPGILLGGLIIDIIFEDLETKTINLLMIITTFRKYLYEIMLTILGLSIAQVLVWEALLLMKGIQIAHLPLITSLAIFLDLILFLFAIIITLLFKDKTKSQITYSFFIILLFISAPLFSLNPIRLITKLSIGLMSVPFFIYAGVLVAIIAILTGIITYIAEKMEW